KLQISQKSDQLASRLAKKSETRGRWYERGKRERTEGARGERNTCRSLYPAVPRASMRGIHILSAKHRPKPGDAASRIRKVEARRKEEEGGEVGSETRTEMAEAAIGIAARKDGWRSEPETDELMLETAGGSCFRASNDLAGATTRRWCWHR
ncbi:hypothetical protein K0M31_004626, partial [Melipona bicolor]